MTAPTSRTVYIIQGRVEGGDLDLEWVDCPLAFSDIYAAMHGADTGAAAMTGERTPWTPSGAALKMLGDIAKIEGMSWMTRIIKRTTTVVEEVVIEPEKVI